MLVPLLTYYKGVFKMSNCSQIAVKKLLIDQK